VRKKSKPVYGLGVNDADYPVAVNAVIGGKQKRLWTCPFYQSWKHMLERCYSAKYQAKSPTYSGCSVSPEWLKFSVFREWMAGQDWEEKELDKDILQPGNKVYGPEVCVFIPAALNLFMTDSAAIRGEWPIGVCWDKGNGKFRASCRNPFTGKHEHLGMFKNPNDAHEAWRKRKHELACIYADQQKDPRIAKALREKYLPAFQRKLK